MRYSRLSLLLCRPEFSHLVEAISSHALHEEADIADKTTGLQWESETGQFYRLKPNLTNGIPRGCLYFIVTLGSLLHWETTLGV